MFLIAGLFAVAQTPTQSHPVSEIDWNQPLPHLFSNGAINVLRPDQTSTSQSMINLFTKSDDDVPGNRMGIFDVGERGWHISARGNSYGASPERNDLIFFKWNNGWENVLTLDGETGHVFIGNEYAERVCADTTRCPSATPEPVGWGSILAFGGGPDVSLTWPTDNSDPLWLGRYNAGSDDTELRVRIGDNPGAANDKFVVGVLSNDAQWHPKLSVGMDGKVGIGTDEPYGKLSVFNSPGATVVDLRTLGVAADQQTHLNFITKDIGKQLGQTGVLGWAIYARGDAWGAANNPEQNDLGFSYYDGSAWNPLLFLDHEGKVGIGTKIPTAKLEVNGNVKANNVGAAAFKRFTVAVTHSVVYPTASQWSENTGQCPAGSKLINWGLEDHRAPTSAQYSYCDCKGDSSTNQVKARHLSDIAANINYGCTCFGLCLNE